MIKYQAQTATPRGGDKNNIPTDGVNIIGKTVLKPVLPEYPTKEEIKEAGIKWIMALTSSRLAGASCMT